MRAPRPAHVLVIGLVLLFGSCVPLGQAVLHETGTQEAVTLEHHAGGARSDDVGLVPGRDARFVVELAIETTSVQEVDRDGATAWQARYRFPIDLEVTAADGKRLLARQSHVDWRDGTGDLSAITRYSSLEESRLDIGPDGGRLEVRAVFRPFEVPESAAGPLRIELGVGEDSRYGAQARLQSVRIEHALDDATNRVVGGIFMLVAGWIVSVIGLVLVLSRVGSTVTEVDLATAGDAEARNKAVLCHLSALLGYIVPFGNIIGPLVVWLLYRDRHAYVDEQGREALNFQLTLLIYMLLASLLVLVLIGIAMLGFLVIFQAVMIVVAAVRCNDGQAWRYPVTIRFV